LKREASALGDVAGRVTALWTRLPSVDNLSTDPAQIYGLPTPKVGGHRSCLLRSTFLVLALASGGASAQDGGVYVYDRAALLLPTNEIVYVDAGVALDGPVALERAAELQRLREESRAPSWVATVTAVVASVVYVADSVRRWVQP
jgi:hypothetical protein